MRILLFGKNGQVGWELQRTLAPLGVVSAHGSEDCNLTNESRICEMIHQLRPEVIINAAAYNAVDRAESDMETAMTVNARAPGIIAEEARILGISFIHYSTDFVFDGDKNEPYTESDTPNPINAYGQSKFAGEKAIQAVGGSYLILRTSWVYSLRRECFVTKVLEWAHKHPALRVVTDQIGSPTWARLLAEITAQLLVMGITEITPWVRERRGLYHLGGNGVVSRFEWAKAILEYDPDKKTQTARAVLPAKSTDFPTPALRPAYSALNCDLFAETFGLSLPNWQQTLRMAITP